MKRLFLLFALVAMFVGQAQAQEFDEVDLQGVWDVSSMEGPINNSIMSIKTLVLMDTLVEYDYGYEYEISPRGGFVEDIAYHSRYDSNTNEWEDYTEDVVEIYDFFISNGNKLHIILDDGMPNMSLKFIITELTENSMSLKTFRSRAGESGTINLTKRVSSGVSEVKASDKDKTEKAYYDINGRQHLKPTQGINIVQYSDGSAEKVLRD